MLELEPALELELELEPELELELELEHELEHELELELEHVLEIADWDLVVRQMEFDHGENDSQETKNHLRDQIESVNEV